jgi:hypothetical protein
MSSRGGCSDDRGAIMVLALFLAVFAIAILYTVVGTVETVLFRERLQDSADSAALSSAVMHARSMNLLVLINLVMAALLAVLVTIKLIESIAILGIIVAGALAWLTGGATLSAIPPLKSVQGQMHEAYEEVKDPIYEGLEALHDVSEAVKTAAPVGAFAVAAADIQTYGKPTVEAGVAIGTRFDLPVNDGSFDQLCGEAGGLPVALTRAGLEEAGIPLMPTLIGELEGPMKSLSSEFADWFCGESDGGGSSSPPGYKRKVTRSYPRTVAAQECEAAEDVEPHKGSVRDVRSPSCDESRREEEEARPDDKTGECRPGADCSFDGPYERRVAQARRECDPTLWPPPSEYWYQERVGHVDYEWTGVFWKRGEPRYDAPERRGGAKYGVTQPPCGPASVSPSIEGYRMRTHPEGHPDRVIPVCSSEEAPPIEKLAPARGTVQPVTFREVTHILSCKRTVEEDIPIDAGEPASTSSGCSKCPKAVASDVSLGDENFQIRAVTQGAPQALQASRVVRLALWDEPEPGNPLEKLKRFGGFSVAQAEYYYDGGPGERDAWMWNMSWRARLRRFRLPEGDLSQVREQCDKVLAPSVCDNVFELGAPEQLRFTH